MGKAQRTKGHSWERDVAVALRHIDPSAKRNVQECQDASVDILTSLPFAIQCKCLKRWSTTPHAIIDQAHNGRLHDKDLALGVVKIDRKEPLAIMKWNQFIELLERTYGSSKD